jgi:Flp pilus assembly protein TadD
LQVVAQWVELVPADPDAHYMRALAAAGAGDNQLALSACKTALRLNPNHGRARQLLRQLQR